MAKLGFNAQRLLVVTVVVVVMVVVVVVAAAAVAQEVAVQAAAVARGAMVVAGDLGAVQWAVVPQEEWAVTGPGLVLELGEVAWGAVGYNGHRRVVGVATSRSGAMFTPQARRGRSIGLPFLSVPWARQWEVAGTDPVQ